METQGNKLSLRVQFVPTERRIVYLFVYSTWGDRVQIEHFPLSGVEGTIDVDRPAAGTVLPHYSTILMQMAELIDCRIVLTGVAMVPLHDLQSNFTKSVSFVDASQNNAVVLEGTVFTPDALPLFSTAEPDLPTLLARFDAATADYVKRADEFVETMEPARPDLPSLYMTSFKQRIGRAFPDILFTNVERTPVTQPAVLDELLGAACFYIGIGEDLFVTACEALASGNQSSGHAATNPEDVALLETAMETIVFAACLPAILTPYAFDKYVSKFGDVRTGERFSSVRVPSVRRRDAVADCEEMSKSNAMLLLDMQTVENIPPAARLLAAAQRALQGAVVYSTLMLVKNPNVDSARDGANQDSAVPLNASTGHMCGLIQVAPSSANAFSLAAIPVAKPRDGGLNGVYLAEGTGNIRSDIRPYGASDRDRNESFQARIRSSPFSTYKWEQRLNMTHGTLFVDDVMDSPNNFYTAVKYAFPLYRGMENARSYLAVNARANTYGVPISNLVAPGTDATLVRMPEMRPETRELCRAMMGFMPPEIPLTMPRAPSDTARREIAAWSTRLRKGAPQQATYVAAFMKDYGETTTRCLDEIVAWVDANTDVLHCDTMLFGEIMHTTLIIVRLFFR